jgi:hypothetical protein
MKCAIVAFLVIASTATSVTVAQDGGGQGPPQKSVVFVSPLPTPTSTTRAPVPTTSQPKLR